MQLHDLKSKNEKDKKRVGRGGARGTYCGKGVKGQKARAGTGGEPIIRGLIKRYPKLRGYRTADGKKNAVVNVENLEHAFKDGEEVTPEVLVEKGLIRREKGKVPTVKILGGGKIKKSLTIKDCKVSKSAEDKIKKAGGSL
ncbi:MAG: 50S ribosomal protein L15 [Patescibacteria group bacterium]